MSAWSLGSSPLGTLLALVCALHVAWTLLRICGLRWAPHLEPTPSVRWGAGLAIAANWLFLLLFRSAV